MTDLTVKSIFFTDESVKINWFNSEKYFFTDESVKRQITDSISENLTDSDLESTPGGGIRFMIVARNVFSKCNYSTLFLGICVLPNRLKIFIIRIILYNAIFFLAKSYSSTYASLQISRVVLVKIVRGPCSLSLDLAWVLLFSLSLSDMLFCFHSEYTVDTPLTIKTVKFHFLYYSKIYIYAISYAILLHYVWSRV